MKKYWTLMRIPEDLVEGSEQWQLLQRFPNPTIIQERGYLFVDYIPDAKERLIAELAEGQTLPELVLEIEEYLLYNNTRGVWMTKELAKQLFELVKPPPESPDLELIDPELLE
jgi:hypothetical protein